MRLKPSASSRHEVNLDPLWSGVQIGMGADLRVCPYPSTQLSNLALPGLSTSRSVSTELHWNKANAPLEAIETHFGHRRQGDPCLYIP
jgi:hypothetical protein